MYSGKCAWIQCRGNILNKFKWQFSSNFAKHFCREHNVDSNTQTQPDLIYCSSIELQQKSSQEFLIWQSFCQVECLEARGTAHGEPEEPCCCLEWRFCQVELLWRPWIQWHFALKHCLPPYWMQCRTNEGCTYVHLKNPPFGTQTHENRYRESTSSIMNKWDSIKQYLSDNS